MAETCILRGLKDAGIVAGDVQEMVDQRIGALFMPHGGPPCCSLSESFLFVVCSMATCRTEASFRLVPGMPQLLAAHLHTSTCLKTLFKVRNALEVQQVSVLA